MSYHRFSIIQGRAVMDRRVSNAQLRTLCALGMYADEGGWCWPSQSTIGEDLGKSRQTVNEDIAHLVRYGYVEKHPITLPSKQIQMRYRLLYDTVPDKGSVESRRQGVSSLPDSNAPLNDSLNTMASVPSADLPLEWQIASGSETIILPDQKQAGYKDAANIISMGFGANQQLAYEIAYTFMNERGIQIPQGKLKGQRKAIKEMIEMGVNATHVIDAVKQLIDKDMTVTDLFSVSKTAVALANPAKIASKFEGL